MHIIEHRAGPFVEHVGIEALWPQQCNAALPVEALHPQTNKLLAQPLHLQGKLFLGLEAMIAVLRMHAEIRDQQACKDVKSKGGGGCAQTSPDNHGATFAETALRPP